MQTYDLKFKADHPNQHPEDRPNLGTQDMQPNPPTRSKLATKASGQCLEKPVSLFCKQELVLKTLFRKIALEGVIARCNLVATNTPRNSQPRNLLATDTAKSTRNLNVAIRAFAAMSEKAGFIAISTQELILTMLFSRGCTRERYYRLAYTLSETATCNLQQVATRTQPMPATKSKPATRPVAGCVRDNI